jgi:RNA polymerase sigma-70 factor (sigma-E family)
MKMARDEEFKEFVLTRRAGLVRTATLLTAGDDHLAEDLVQTTLSRLYVAWPRVRRLENRDAYARRALANALIDETRRPWRREQSLAELPDRAPRVAAASERVEELYRALRTLAPRMRTALVYRYFHDLSVAETAEALGCSQGTVKSQTARALDRLRSEMGAVLAEPAADLPAPKTPTNHHSTVKEYRHV